MSWYNKDFKRRVPFLIDCSSTSAGAIDFTVTIPTEYDDFWNNTRSDGFDVVITDYTGQQLAFQRLTWNPATPRGIFQVSGYTLPASNTMLVGYVYWDNPDQSSDLSTSVSVSSAKLGQIYLGAPFGNIINLQSRSGLSTVPTTIGIIHFLCRGLGPVPCVGTARHYLRLPRSSSGSLGGHWGPFNS